MDKKLEGKILLLILSLILMVLIILWPIYFFVFAGINAITVGLNELIFFGIIEFVLIIILIIFWPLYSKFFAQK
jgi:hypothetical protein